MVGQDLQQVTRIQVIKTAVTMASQQDDSVVPLTLLVMMTLAVLVPALEPAMIVTKAAAVIKDAVVIKVMISFSSELLRRKHAAYRQRVKHQRYGPDEYKMATVAIMHIVAHAHPMSGLFALMQKELSTF